MRSLQLTSAHNMPMAPSAHRSTGRPPAADTSSRRTEAASRVGTSAMSQSTIRIELAEVDHGSETATAVTSPSAICPSRGARTLSFMPIDSGLRSDMVVILAVIVADLGAFAQRRQAAPRAHTVALQHFIKPRVIRGKLCTIDLRVPEVDDPSREATILATQAAMQQPDQQVGILAAPTAEASIEPVDPLEIGAPNRKIAGACPAPLARP